MSKSNKTLFYDSENKKINAHIISKVAVYALVVHCLLIFGFAHIGVNALAIANVFSVIMWSIGLVLLNKKPTLAFYLFCIEVTLHSILVCSILGMQLGFQFYLWTVACLLALIIDFKFQFRTALMIGCMWVILFAALYFLFGDINYPYAYSDYLPYVHFINILIAGFPMVYIVTMVRAAAITQRIELTKQASLDYLTHLYNRRFTHTWLANKQKHMAKKPSHHFIIIADIDFFKRINDNHGHDIGDIVLAKTAKTIKSSITPLDIAARWGGEEFLFTLSDLDQQQAYEQVEQLRLQIAKQHNPETELNLKITMSFGMAPWLADVSLEHTLKKADEALYLSKTSGKNKTTVAK
ncbi:GGDEF domain-containing protein [Pseudoalteromonas sp. MMG010]|uniref:GGDEF domain-containing protein n=1 Tax=Pseudoalteromonas sp. MMG010 TaxID=2822685 RepID=UPI001B3A133F|nr:GGDEF domain-containing protein [Pseudoalteromonas sp. MMG010]MBQ4834088.1 GGDEF domain-containing protein [Pseudoalteromonas sp. MMG010]